MVFLLILRHCSLPFYNALSAKAISDQRPTSNIGVSALSDAYCVMHNFQVPDAELFTERMALLFW